MSWLSSSYSVYTQPPELRLFLTGLCINLSFTFFSLFASYISPLQPLYLPLFVVYYYVHELGHSLEVTHELGVTSPRMHYSCSYEQTPTSSTLFYRALVFLTREAISKFVDFILMPSLITTEYAFIVLHLVQFTLNSWFHQYSFLFCLSYACQYHLTGE